MDKKKIIRLWVLVILADYYFQFFTSRYWFDHAIPFLKKSGLLPW